MNIPALPVPDKPAPKSNSLAAKRIRVYKCGARLRVPTDSGTRGEVIFTCKLDKHEQSVPHQEIGFVIMQNETARRFMITWTDEGMATLRQRMTSTKPRPKIRAIQ